MRSLCCALVLVAGCSRPLDRLVAKSGELSAITYSDPAPVYKRATSITPNVPTVTGGNATLFIVTPRLPDGLELDAVTGQITGSPVSTMSERVFEIVASNEAGTVKVELAVRIVDDAPSSLTYEPAEIVVPRGRQMPNLAPTTLGGLPLRFVSSSPLPAGIQLDRQTGLLFGFPTDISARQSFTISAENDFGATQTSIAMTVTEAPPRLSYTGSPFSAIKDEAFSTGAPNNSGGAVESCTAVLPTGLSIDASNCEISGVPSAQTPLTDVTVLASNAGGTGSTVVRLSVNAPLSLSPATMTITAAGFEHQVFTAAGGVAPRSFAIASGPGTIDPITGDYQPNGEVGVSTVQVRDSLGHVASAVVDNRSLLVGRTLPASEVRSLVATQTAVIAGGNFDTVVPHLTGGLVAVDPSSFDVAHGFDVKDGFDDLVTSMLQVGNSLYVGGRFQQYRGRLARGLAKIDLVTGVLDEAFTRPVGFTPRLLSSTGVASEVLAMAADGQYLYVGGVFESYRGVLVKNLARVDLTTGELDAAWSPSAINGKVRALAVNGSEVWVGGEFTDFSNFLAGDAYLVRYSGFQSTGFAANGAVNGFAKSGTDLYAVGAFTSLLSGSVNRTHAAKIDMATSTVDVSFVASVAATGVSAAISQTGLYVAAGSQVVRLSSTSGAVDSGFGTGTGFNFPVTNLCADDAGGVFVSGAFSSYNGATASRVVHLQADGSVVSGTARAKTLSGTYSPFVLNAPMVFAMGRLYVGGNFRYWGGYSAANLVKIDFATKKPDLAFLQHGRTDAAVSALLLSPSQDRLYVGGDFANYDGSACQALTRVTLDGQQEHGTGAYGCGAFPVSSTVNALASVTGGEVLVGGGFGTYASSPQQNLVALSTILPTRTSSIPSSGVSSPVLALAQGPSGPSGDPTIFVGGALNNALGVATSNLARIRLPPAGVGSLIAGYSQSPALIIYSLAYDSISDALYMGGLPAGPSGQPAIHFVVGQTGATIPTAVGGTTNSGGSPTVDAMLIAGSTAWLAGSFDGYTYAGTTLSTGAIVQVAADGSYRPNPQFRANLNTPSSSGNSGKVKALATSVDALFAGGNFSHYDRDQVGVLVGVDPSTGALLR